MKASRTLIVLLASAASAHDLREGFAAVPRLLGGRKFLAELKARNALPAAFEKSAMNIEERAVKLPARQNAAGMCGPGIASCATECCSPEG